MLLSTVSKPLLRECSYPTPTLPELIHRKHHRFEWVMTTCDWGKNSAVSSIRCSIGQHITPLAEPILPRTRLHGCPRVSTRKGVGHRGLIPCGIIFTCSWRHTGEGAISRPRWGRSTTEHIEIYIYICISYRFNFPVVTVENHCAGAIAFF